MSNRARLLPGSAGGPHRVPANFRKALSLALGLSLPLLALGATQAPPLPETGFNAAEFIAGSSKLLREREPELSPAEYTMYEEVVPMVKEQPEFALRLLEQMVAKKETSAAFDLVLGNLYFELQRFPESEASYRRAIAKYPEFRRAWENLGVLCFSTDRPAEAVPCLSKVLTLGGWEARILGLLGLCLARSDNAMAAELAYMQATVIEPDNPDWLEGLLQIVVATKQYSRAESLLRQLTRLAPRESRNWEMLANVLIQQDRPRDAIVPLEVAAGLEIISPAGLRLLGDLYADAGLAPQAVRIYQRLATRDPDSGADRMLRYARALLAAGDLAAAEKLLAGAAASVSGEQRIIYLQIRSECLSARGDLAGARGQLELLLASDPLNGRALVRLAEIQIAQGEAALAALTLESATRVPESAFAANVQLAQLKVDDHQYAEAIALLDAALRIENSPVVQEYQARIAALIDRHE